MRLSLIAGTMESGTESGRSLLVGKDRHTILDSGFHSRYHSGFYTLPVCMSATKIELPLVKKNPSFVLGACNLATNLHVLPR